MELIGKTQPNNVELEEAVLGAMMIDSDAVLEVTEILRPEVFYKIHNQKIYNAIYELYKDSQPTDLLTVSERMRKDGTLDAVGGEYYLINLTQKIGSSAHVEHYARLLMEKFILREIIKQSSKIIEESYKDEASPFELIDESYQAFNNLTEYVFRKKEKVFKQIVDSVIDKGIKLKTGEIESGLPTPITNMTTSTGGWRKGELIYIAARPSMGKTAYSLKTALDNSKIGKTVAIFSLETNAETLTSRLLSMEYKIDNSHFIKTGIDNIDYEKLKDGYFKELPIIIDDTPSLSISQFQIKAKRLKAKNNIDLIIIDYIQLMSGEKGQRGNRENEISNISRGLKKTAMELNIPVIAISQLNRSVEARQGHKRPMISDMRESGSLEQDADMIMFIYRPEYYGFTEWDDYEQLPTYGEAEYIVAKNKNGSLVRNRMRFEGRYTLFSDILSDESNELQTMTVDEAFGKDDIPF